MFTAPMIDAPEGYEYTPAPAEVQAMLRLRFEDSGITAVVPSADGRFTRYRHNIENWWDGARIVQDNGDGTFSYTNPYTRETDRFDFTGYYQRDGRHMPWMENGNY